MFRRFTAIVILILTAAGCFAFDVVLAISPGQLERRIKRDANSLLNTRLEFASVAFTFKEGLVLKEIEIGPEENPLVKVEKTVLKLNIWKLQATKLTIDKPEIFLQVNSDGTTSFDSLIIKSEGKSTGPPAKIPEIVVNEGSASLKAFLNKDEFVESHFTDIEISLEPEPETGIISASLIAENKEIGKLTASGTIDTGLKDTLLRTSIKDVTISAMKKILPEDVGEVFDDLDLTGNVDMVSWLKFKNGKPEFKAEIISLGCRLKYKDFPLEVGNIRGNAALTTKGIELQNFEGMCYGNPVVLKGTLLFGNASPEIRLQITADDLKTSEEIISAIPEIERKIIEDFAPLGQADFTIDIFKPAGVLVPSVEVIVGAEGKASIAYTEFPYRLENLRGTVTITSDKIEIKDVTSTAGEQTVIGNGYVIPHDESVEMDIRIKGTNVQINNKLREALEKENHETWDVFNPSGKASLDVAITSAANEENVSVDVKVIFDGSGVVKPTPFPITIDKIKGLLHILPEGGTKLSGIEGVVSGGKITVRDVIIPESETSESTIDAVFSNAIVGGDVTQALAASLEENFDDLETNGLAEGQIRLHRPEGEKDYIFTGRVNVEKGELLHNQFPIKAENLKGLLLIKPDGYYIRNMTGTVADGALEAWGEILDPRDGERKIRLRFEGFDILADEKLRNALPKELKETWDEFQPYGRLDAAVWLDGNLPFENISKILKLNLLDVSAKYVEFPYQVSGIRGPVRSNIDTGNIELKNLRTKDGKLKLTGSVARKEQHTITDLHIEALSVKLDNSLRDAMPEEIKTMWKDIELGGKASGTVKLHVYEPENSPAAVYYEVLLRPEDAFLEAGFPFNEFSGKVTLKGHVAPNDDHELKSGLVQAQNFKVNGLPVTWASLPIKLDEKSVTFDPITGKMANGTLSGMVKVLFDNKSTFTGSFEVNDASVRTAAIELFGDKMDKTTGRASAWIRFQGEGSNDNALRGKGEFTIKNANLWEVPFFSALVKQLSLGALPKVEFSECKGHFKIKGDRLIFDKVYFHSSVINLDGSGELYLDGRIDFIFRMSLISKLIPIPVIQDIISRLEGEINAVRAQGTAKKVKITLAPKEILKTIKWLNESDDK